MLTDNMLKHLNKQVTIEFYSSNLYLQMSAWCEHKGLDGSARFLKAHAAEEMQHMQKIFGYILDTGGLPVLEAIEKPEMEYQDLKDIFSQTLDHEKMITKQINEIVDIAMSEKDYSTFNFLQWYVSEQHEEEKLFNSIIDKMNVIGLEGRGLFMIDREIGALAGSAH